MTAAHATRLLLVRSKQTRKIRRLFAFLMQVNGIKDPIYHDLNFGTWWVREAEQRQP